MRVSTPFNYQGSKLRELPRIREIIPPGSSICESFVGSGVVFGHLGRPGACPVNDACPDVAAIWLYAQREDVEFFRMCSDLMREENRRPEFFYERRAEYNELLASDADDRRRTALFYYLINSCHAAMIRYGPEGFNVPYKLYLSNGRKYHVAERLKYLRHFARNIRVVSAMDGVEHVTHFYDDVDFVYCDPPYTNSGVTYESDWSDARLLELDEVLSDLARRGVRSVVSNFKNDEVFERMRFDHREDFVSFRQAAGGKKVVQKNDVLLTYGFVPERRETGRLEEYFA